MRLHLAPAPLLHLIATILLTSAPAAATPHPPPSQLAGFDYHELFGRWECGGTPCGYYTQLCCTSNSGCYTNYLTQAECTPNLKPEVGSTSAGHWSYYTKTTVVTDKETITTVMSTFIGGPTGGQCSAPGESKCGSKCCGTDEYCEDGECHPSEPGESSSAPASNTPASNTPTTTSPNINTNTVSSTESGALPPVRQTSYSGVIITQTTTPTTTTVVPYITPVATGANITITESHHSNGLSGGAIAGIVIGVLVALFLLGLLCFYCCLKGIWDAFLALFGLRDRRKVKETSTYERRTHYSSDGRKRTWYGAPVKTRKEKRESGGGVGTLVGIGAGLAGLWAILGLKRRREDRRRAEIEKYRHNQSEYSYESDYYTSQSSASSDERRTERYSRHTDVRRSGSRRP